VLLKKIDRFLKKKKKKMSDVVSSSSDHEAYRRRAHPLPIPLQRTCQNLNPALRPVPLLWPPDFGLKLSMPLLSGKAIDGDALGPDWLFCALSFFGQ